MTRITNRSAGLAVPRGRPGIGPGTSNDAKLVVKHTFIEVVDVDASPPMRTRGFTDSDFVVPSSNLSRDGLPLVRLRSGEESDGVVDLAASLPTQLMPNTPGNSPFPEFLSPQAMVGQSLAHVGAYVQGNLQYQGPPFSDLRMQNSSRHLDATDWQKVGTETYAVPQKPQQPWVQPQAQLHHVQDRKPQQPALRAPRQRRWQAHPDAHSQHQPLQQQNFHPNQDIRQQTEGSWQSRSRTQYEPRGNQKPLNSKGFKLPVQLQSLLPEHSSFESRSISYAGMQTKSCMEQDTDVSRTTVMLRDLPDGFTRDGLLRLIDSEGFSGKYCFIYLPMAFDTGSSLGYAFIDLTSPADAERFVQHFFSFGSLAQGQTPFSVSWNNKHHGLEQHIERYRNSPVMHAAVPDEWKPLIFLDGQRVPFPSPTKPIRAPKWRGCRRDSGV